MRFIAVIIVVAAVLAAGPLVYLGIGSVGGWGVLRDEPVARWVVNSIWVSGCQTLLAAAACSAAGFALAAYDFAGRRAVIALMLATLLLPGPVAAIGLFEATLALGGLDEFWAVILPGSFGVFGVFLYAAAFRSLPASRLEAARLDGCSEPRLWWGLALPHARPTTAAFALLHFLGSWNALLWPAAVLVTEERQTVAVALSTLARRADVEADPSRLLAAVAASLVPVAVLFLLVVPALVGGGPGVVRPTASPRPGRRTGSGRGRRSR